MSYKYRKLEDGNVRGLCVRCLTNFQHPKGKKFLSICKYCNKEIANMDEEQRIKDKEDYRDNYFFAKETMNKISKGEKVDFIERLENGDDDNINKFIKAVKKEDKMKLELCAIFTEFEKTVTVKEGVRKAHPERFNNVFFENGYYVAKIFNRKGEFVCKGSYTKDKERAAREAQFLHFHRPKEKIKKASVWDEYYTRIRYEQHQSISPKDQQSITS